LTCHLNHRNLNSHVANIIPTAVFYKTKSIDIALQSECIREVSEDYYCTEVNENVCDFNEGSEYVMQINGKPLSSYN